jgi:hypothetical protein
VRAALLWAYGDSAKLTLAIKLQIKSAVLWFHLSLAKDYLRHTEMALAGLDGSSVPTELRTELLLGYGHALWHIRGPVPDMGKAFAEALDLATQIGSDTLCVRALGYLGPLDPGRALRREPRACRAIFRSRQIASGCRDPADRFPQRGPSLHFLGRHREAMERLQAVLAGDAARKGPNMPITRWWTAKSRP